jgi:hypothetical protein
LCWPAAMTWKVYKSLVYWGAIDCAILGTISKCKTVDVGDKELVVGGDQERYELSSFVHRQEGLAWGVEHFKRLVYPCPTC